MMMCWFWRVLIWSAVGVLWGVLILLRRPQAQGTACIFIPMAMIVGPVLILVDLLAWIISRIGSWLGKDLV